MKINERIHTPLGLGVVQGQLSTVNPKDETARVIVRVKLTESIRARLADANCLTPRAQISGLWTFTPQELTA